MGGGELLLLARSGQPEEISVQAKLVRGMCCFAFPATPKKTGGRRRSVLPLSAKLNPKKPDMRVPDGIFRTMGSWKCMKNCGACCYLEPSEREGLDSFLSPEEYKLYMSMVGNDGWCIHYDKTARTCTIFEDRPDFCRVSKPKLAKMLGETDDSAIEVGAIDSCLDHINGIYGPESEEMQRYSRLVDVDLDDQSDDDREEGILIDITPDDSEFDDDEDEEPQLGGQGLSL